MNILREVLPTSSMKEMVQCAIHNIEFYLKNRSELADIKKTDEELNDFLKSLYKVIDLYEINQIPKWFKNHNPYHFTSSGFPYFTPNFHWLFSFKEWVEILISGEGIIDEDNKTIIKNGKPISAEIWRNSKS